MTLADNPAANDGGQGSGPAPGSELTIPKHRLDEVLAENRRLKEEQSFKDRLYLEERQRVVQAQQPTPQEAELTPDDTGLDPQMHQAVMKAASKITERALKKQAENFGYQLGAIANRAEKAELLASKGSDKAKYIPEIERRQQDHYRLTGTYLPAETALDLIQSKEKDERIRELEARVAGLPANQTQTQNQNPPPATNQPTYQSTQGVPGAAGTRQIPTGGGGAGTPAAKSFSEQSVEEMEARLEEQFRSGARL